MLCNLSIIIPVYNAGKKISRTLDSILHQDYFDYEIIIVDDGSTDNSLEICQKYSDYYKNINTYHIDNQGVSNARNYGLKKAKSKYLMFIDADDTINKGCFKKMIEELEKNNLDLVICNYNIIDEMNERYSVNNKDSVFIQNIHDIALNYWDFYHLGYINSPWNKLYKKSIIDENKIEFNVNISMGEDCDFNLRYFMKMQRVHIVNDYLYNYYLYENQSSKKIIKNHFLMIKIIFDRIDEFLKKECVLTSDYYDRYYSEYFNEIKSSIKNVMKEESSIHEKIKQLTRISKDQRTKCMLKKVKIKSIKDLCLKILLIFVRLGRYKR